MESTRKQRGQQGEDLAVQFLSDRGFRIIERNWRPGNDHRGEIDCIAWHGKTLCFIEVKTRSSNERGAPQEAVTRSKQRQISSLANAYVSLRRIQDIPCRFDVIEVWATGGDREARIVIHENAFDYVSGSGRGNRVF